MVGASLILPMFRRTGVVKKAQFPPLQWLTALMSGGKKMIASSRLISVFTTALGMAALLVGPGTISNAGAQGNEADDDALQIEEIIVTSRKREESLFDIPVSVTAFSSEDILNAGLEELPDLVSYTPGFHYAENSVTRGVHR